MPGYRTPEDIANRAVQHCRRQRFASFTDQNDEAQETYFVYDKLRLAELRNNLWRFAIKRAVLRAVDTARIVLATHASTASGATLPFTDTTGVLVGQLVAGTNIAAGATVLSIAPNTSVTLSLAITGTVGSGASITFGPLTFLWTPPDYDATLFYSVESVVVSAGEWWQSRAASNHGNTPAAGPLWSRYTGPDTMQAWDTTETYYTGELTLASDGDTYLSLVTQNEGKNPLTTTGFWLLVGGTVAALSILYPIGTGPRSDLSTSNIFRLPRGYLRKAPTSPKAGIGTWLGVPTNLMREDWVFEGNYIVSGAVQPLLIRFVCDIIDVTEMDPEFCEMLAARIAEETAPVLVGRLSAEITLGAADTGLLQVILANTRRHYVSERSKAILSNGIETGSIDPPLDSYISSRA